MGENISDVDLERFLRRRDRISREYLALGGEGPAPALDARVLEEARVALEQDAKGSLWRRRRWPAITALAATVLLSLGLILRVALESDQAVFAPPRATTATGPAETDGISTQSAVEQPGTLAPARAPDPATPPELPRPQIEGEITSAPERAKLAAPAPADTRAREDFAKKRSEPAARPEAGLMKEESLRMQQSNEAVSAPAAAPPAPAASETRDDASKDEVSGAREPKAAMRTLGSAKLDEAQRLRDPESWLEEIDRLRAAGQNEAADREMQRFLETYPRYLEEHPRPPTQ